MLRYIVQRLMYMLLVLWLISIATFIIIQLPPGDYLSTVIARLESSGGTVSEDVIEGLRLRYGLDLPMHQRYVNWFSSVLQGNYGFSYTWQQPVRDIIGERLLLTFAIALLSAVVSGSLITGVLLRLEYAVHTRRHVSSGADATAWRP